ncbi:MAG: alpha/beta hydrolase [Clostridiales bacterium]|nr:alpha/beta hydrolase [Clostridiales bacterium]
MYTDSRRNQNLMKAIKRMHTLVENNDIERQRASKDNLGNLLIRSKDMCYEDIDVDGIEAELVSVKRSHMKKYILLYCHGGGYNTGSLKYARSITNKLASSTSMDVLSFNYRLAPEHPYPAALEDALKVWDYLMYLGYGARDVIIAGDSAGGNLALVLTMKLRDQHRILPRGLILFSPWTDLTRSGHSHETKQEIDPILTEEYLTRSIEDYAGAQNLEDPFLSPLYGDFTNFPPTLIQAGSNGILLSDSRELHRRMVKFHVGAKLTVYPGMWHVFQMSPFKTAYEAMDQAAEFIFDICR